MKQTGGDALARQLALEGVTDVFGVPGVQLDWAVDGQVGHRRGVGLFADLQEPAGTVLGQHEDRGCEEDEHEAEAGHVGSFRGHTASTPAARVRFHGNAVAPAGV